MTRGHPLTAARKGVNRLVSRERAANDHGLANLRNWQGPHQNSQERPPRDHAPAGSPHVDEPRTSVDGRSPATEHAHDRHEHPSHSPRQPRDLQLQDERASLHLAHPRGEVTPTGRCQCVSAVSVYGEADAGDRLVSVGEGVGVDGPPSTHRVGRGLCLTDRVTSRFRSAPVGEGDEDGFGGLRGLVAEAVEDARGDVHAVAGLQDVPVVVGDHG